MTKKRKKKAPGLATQEQIKPALDAKADGDAKNSETEKENIEAATPPPEAEKAETAQQAEPEAIAIADSAEVIPDDGGSGQTGELSKPADTAADTSAAKKAAGEADEAKPIEIKGVTVVSEVTESSTAPSADSVPIADPVITIDIGDGDTKKGRGRKKGSDMDGMVVGVDVVSETPGKETLSLQLDPKKLKKMQAKQLRAEKKKSRKQAVGKIGKSFGDRIREGVKDDAPKVGDKDKDIKAYTLEMHFINVVAMILLFAVISVMLIVVKREEGDSEHENRELAKFPTLSVSSWFSGEFASGVTEFYTDTIPYRDELLPISSHISKLFGLSSFREHSTIQIGGKGDVETQTFTGTVTTQEVTIYTGPRPTDTDKATETTPGSATTPSATGTTTPVTTLPVEDPNDGKLSNGILIVGSGKNVRALECYGGSFSNGKRYAEFVNKYKVELGEYVNVYSMCIPTAFAFYCPDKFKDEYGSTIDNINNIRNYLDGVADVDVYSVLEKHTKEYIYSRTDHHWQPLGAYYAAQKFAEVSQVPFAELSTYEKVVETDFVGTLYAYSNNNNELLENPDTFTYYKPSNNDKLTVRYYDINFNNPQRSQLFFKAAQKINLYSSFLGTDKQIAEIETDCDNGRVLVIFKDSFGNALVPFLTGSYSKIYVVDLRYFTPNAIEFCENVGATDVLFATCMFTNTSSGKVNYIENLRVQNRTEPANTEE